MDRRRSGTKTRPPSQEEIECWNSTRSALNEVARVQSHATKSETLHKVNKYLTGLPHDDSSPTDDLESLRGVREKLTSGLNEIKQNAEAEAQAISDALEQLQVLIALRRGPDGDKRSRRQRNSPASSLPGSPRNNSFTNLNTHGNGIVLHHGGPQSATSISSSRGSQGPSAATRDPKAKREWLNLQLPLQPGRKVAFRQPNQTDGETWILAVVKKCIGGDKNKYEVQDDDTEDGENPQEYKTTLKSLIPLPDPKAPANSPAHPSAYDEFPPGKTVLGLYPDTSCFYRAIVVATPSSAVRAKQEPAYRLRFEDDDDMIRVVKVEDVVEAPS